MLPGLLKADAGVLFASHEPLMGPIAADFTQLGWGIIGAMTGRGAVRPDPAWVQSLINQYREADIPFFLKDNLGQVSDMLEFWEDSHNWPESP